MKQLSQVHPETKKIIINFLHADDVSVPQPMNEKKIFFFNIEEKNSRSTHIPIW